MRTAMSILLVAAAVLVGCAKEEKKVQTAQTPTVQDTTHLKPVQDPTPVPSNNDAGQPDSTATPSGVDTTPPAPPAPPVPPAPQPRTHVVQRGDTLYSLARQYLGSGRRWREIQELNGGIDPSRLRIGMTLKIPAE